MDAKKKKLLLSLCGLFAGLLNGLFGAGGGLLAVPALERYGGLETPKAPAPALLAMLPLSFVSIAVYLLRTPFDWESVPFVALGVLPGSLIGAKLLGKIPGKWIRRIFCALMLAAGIRMLF